jgi:hypothetical protein
MYDSADKEIGRETVEDMFKSRSGASVQLGLSYAQLAFPSSVP